MLLKRMAVISFCSALVACSTSHQLNFIPSQQIESSGVSLNWDLKGISVAKGLDKDLTGPFPDSDLKSFSELWRSNLEQTLILKRVFSSDSPKKIDLNVEILTLDIPSAGVNFDVKVEAKYQIVERKTQRVIFSKSIKSVGSTPFGFALKGSTRAMESVNRAVSSNISQFIFEVEATGL